MCCATIKAQHDAHSVNIGYRKGLLYDLAQGEQKALGGSHCRDEAPGCDALEWLSDGAYGGLSLLFCGASN